MNRKKGYRSGYHNIFIEKKQVRKHWSNNDFKVLKDKTCQPRI